MKLTSIIAVIAFLVVVVGVKYIERTNQFSDAKADLIDHDVIKKKYIKRNGVFDFCEMVPEFASWKRCVRHNQRSTEVCLISSGNASCYTIPKESI